MRGRAGRPLPPAVADAEARHGHYSMHLVWDPDDAIYVVTVPELPGCRTHGATAEEAARNGREAIASWLGAARARGKAVPAPHEERHPLPADEARALALTAD